jgi:starch-binding outer membrane protein, SusD/RagB family
MKLINKFFIGAFTASLILTGCKKELDLRPTDTIIDETTFLDVEDIRRGVNGVHARMGAFANDLYVNALLSDEAKLGAGNAGQGALTYRLSIQCRWYNWWRCYWCIL